MRGFFFGLILSLSLFAESPWRAELKEQIQTQLGIWKSHPDYGPLIALDRYLNSEHGIKVILATGARELNVAQLMRTGGVTPRVFPKNDPLGVAVAIANTLNEKQADFYVSLLKKGAANLGHMSGGVRGLSEPAMESIRFLRKLEGDDRIDLVRSDVARALGRFENWIQYDTLVEWSKKDEFRKLIDSRRLSDQTVLGNLLHVIGRETALSENVHFLRAAAWVLDSRVPFTLDERQDYLVNISRQAGNLLGNERIVPYRAILAHRNGFRKYVTKRDEIDSRFQKKAFERLLEAEVKQIATETGSQNNFKDEIEPLRELWEACE